MRVVFALSCLAACGRLGFGDLTSTDGGGPRTGDGSGASTGASGPRWLKLFGIEGNQTLLAGATGSVSAIQAFSGSFGADDGVALLGNAAISTALVRYHADGTVQDATTLDATGYCEMRSVAVVGADTVVAGYTSGNATPAYGACSITSFRQQPIALRIDGTRGQSAVAAWPSSGMNAQAWFITALADGTFALSGIYGGGLTIGSAVPTAMVDPNTWLARTQAGSSTAATWAKGLSANVEVHAGPVAASGTTTYAFGTFSASTTLLGTPLTNRGAYDNWIARIEGDGTVAWVRAIGSPAVEPGYGNDSALATLADGSLLVALRTTGDITYDSMTFPASAGPGLVLHLDATGALLGGFRLPDMPRIVTIGSRVFAAMNISAPLTVGSTTYTPEGSDGVVVELGPTGPIAVVGALTGAGGQTIDELAAIGPDALALGGLSAGALTFGSTSLNSGGNRVRVIAVLGL